MPYFYDLRQPPKIRSHTVEWRCPRWAYERFMELAGMIDALAPDAPEVASYQEEIRTLPGYPRYYDPDRDLIVPIVTTVRG